MRFTAFLWLVDAGGKILWEKSLDSLEIFDVVMQGGDHALVLLNSTDKGATEYHLWTVNRAGKFVTQTTQPVPAGIAPRG